MLRANVHPVIRIIVLGVPLIVVTWWLISPYFVDDVMNDDFSTSISEQQTPASKPARDTASTTTSVAPAAPTLLGTGTIMNFVGWSSLSWRTGATFVHDWAALAVGLLVIGHIYRALHDPEARRGMRTGRVSGYWAQAQHPAWHPPD